MCWWDISLLPMLLCWCAYICSIIETMTPWRFPLNIMFGPEVGTYVISLCRENSLCKFLYLYLKRIFTFIIYLQMAKTGKSTFWEMKTIFFWAVNWMFLQNITTAAYGSMLRIVFANFYVYLKCTFLSVYPYLFLKGPIWIGVFTKEWLHFSGCEI